jgi:hypothetical protein
MEVKNRGHGHLNCVALQMFEFSGSDHRRTRIDPPIATDRRESRVGADRSGDP